MKIWGIKNCQSVKKALDFLEQNGMEYEFVDYKKNPPSLDDLARWVEKVGIESVLNHKGRTYKDLGVKEMNLDTQGKIELMRENPTLIKRPVLEIGEECYFGFDEKKYEEIL